MKRHIFTAFVTTVLLAACGQNAGDADNKVRKQAQDAPASSMPSASNGTLPVPAERAGDYQLFIQECNGGWSAAERSEATEAYCRCIAGYVFDKYDDATYKRIDGALRRRERNDEVAAFEADLVENGLKACPAPKV